MCNNSNESLANDELQEALQNAETEHEVNLTIPNKNLANDELQEALQNAETEHEVNLTIPNEKTLDIKSQILAENSKINREILMPQLVDNEKQKRKLKMLLLFGILIFITAQITLMSVYIGQLVYSVTIGSNNLTNINKELCESLISFMKFFVSATLCEFIAMLFFIVKYVFDKSIFELIKLFKFSDTDSNTESKNVDNQNLNYNDKDNSKSA